MKYAYTVIKESRYDEKELKTFSSHKKAVEFIDSLINGIDTISEMCVTSGEKIFYETDYTENKLWTKKINQRTNLNNIHYYRWEYFQKEIYKIKIIKIY